MDRRTRGNEVSDRANRGSIQNHDTYCVYDLDSGSDADATVW